MRDLDAHDTAAEVDASFRTQRRIAVRHGSILLGVLLAVPSFNLVLDWWSSGQVFGGVSPAFAMAGGGLYVFFFVLAVVAGGAANRAEDRMLGEPARPDDPNAVP